MDLIIRFYKRNSFILVLASYFVLVFIIGLSGEFPINDDWIFKRQVDAFQAGVKPLSELIDPSFIFQGGLGFAWAEIFSADFADLRRLTIIHYVIFMLGVYKLLGVLKSSDSIRFLTFITLGFNPLIFFSSFTFMTEVYFLSYLVWAVYFYLRYFDSKKLGYLALALILTSLTILIRQIGVLLFLSYVGIEVYNLVILRAKVTAKTILGVVLGVVVVLVTIYFWSTWPKVVKPDSTDFLKGLISPEKLISRLKDVWMILPYFGYFLLPLSFYTFIRLESSKAKFRIMALSVIPAILLYKFDVFPLGNVFYLENLLTKPNFQLNLSIFDNVPYKILLAYLTSLGLVYLFYYLYKHTILSLSRVRLTTVQLYLLTSSLLMLASVFISSDFYDRYLLPFIVLFVLFIGTLFEKSLHVIKTKYSKLPITLIVLLFVFSTFALTHEYIVQTRVRWLLAEELRNVTGYTTQIYVDSTYGKYMNSVIRKDFAGLDSGDPISDYVCFVDNYTLESPGSIYRAISTVDGLLEDVLTKPRVYESRKVQGLPKIKNNLEDLMINVEYRSLLYNLLGKRSFVGAWCEDVV